MLDTSISSKNTFTYDTSKEIQEDARKSASCKNSKDIFMGLGSWDPAAKAHMMACDKQPKDSTTMYYKETIL
jgi:hypothetical protein